MGSEEMTSGAISWSIFEWICVGLVSSVLGLALTIVTIDWACRKIRSINLTLLCMMQASFAVYVFHELVMNLVMWLWIFILKTGFGFDRLRWTVKHNGPSGVDHRARVA